MKNVLASPAARWTVLGAVVVIGLVIALASTLGGPGGRGDDHTLTTPAGALAPDSGGPPALSERSVADDDQRDAADLADCRDPAVPATTSGPVAGFMVGCMDDGSQTTLGKIQAETPMVLNIWAYWCEPCRRELPALREAQQELDGEVKVVLVHSDPAETKGLDVLRELGITDVIAAEDPEKELPVDLGAPPVLPLTLFVSAGGEVQHLLVRPMDSKEDVLEQISEHLGITA